MSGVALSSVGLPGFSAGAAGPDFALDHAGIPRRRSDVVYLKLMVFFAAAAALAGPASSQVVDPGLSWSGASGTFAGTACGGFTCTPFQTTVSVGEMVTVQVRGAYNRAFVVGLSGSATQCFAIGGIVHNLVLDFPIMIVVSGTLVDGDPALVCPGGRVVFNFAFPFMPSGTSLSIQAAAELPNGTPALTSAITVTVL